MPIKTEGREQTLSSGSEVKIENSSPITVYYFSGTGNTQVMAKKIVDTFKNRGFKATLIGIEDVDKISISDNEIIGLGFPIAAFTTHQIFFDFLKRIEKVNSNYVFAFDTMAGTSLLGIMGKLKTVLEKKGFKPLGFKEFKMPVNFFMKLPEDWQKKRVEQAIKHAEDFVDTLITGKAKWSKVPIMSDIMACLSQKLYKITQHKWHQRFLKMKVHELKCTSCGLCAAKCPVKNISMQKNAEIEDHCQYCFRCVGICPESAISGILSPRSLHYLADGAHF